MTMKYWQNGWGRSAAAKSISVFRKKEWRKNWWSWRRRMRNLCCRRIRRRSSVRREEPSERWKRSQDGWIFRAYSVWKRLIYPTSTDSRRLVPWWFMKKENQSAAITESSSSALSPGRMTMLPCMKSLQGVLHTACGSRKKCRRKNSVQSMAVLHASRILLWWMVEEGRSISAWKCWMNYIWIFRSVVW